MLSVVRLCIRITHYSVVEELASYITVHVVQRKYFVELEEMLVKCRSKVFMNT